LQIIIFILILLTPINLGDVKMTTQQSHNITVYSTGYCPYCVRAKDLLTRKGLEYEEINVEHDQNIREEMTKKAGGRRTVPQIFIGDFHVGGCDDLHALEASGELDKIIKGIK